MATIKSYSDLQQSKKLAEILPIESADMVWISIEDDESFEGTYEALPKGCSLVAIDDNPIPCWSLAALLKIIPYPELREQYNGNWTCRVSNANTTFLWEDDNPIDACYKMILKLNELKML